MLRRDARVRRRGRPAHATVIDARPLDASPAGEGTPAVRRFRLRLWVAPGDGPGFEADMVMAHTGPGTPGIGSSLEVLHHRGRVIPRHPPPAGPAASPGDEASPDTVATPPGPMEMLGDVLRHLDDAARLAHRATPATTGSAGADADASSEAVTAPEMSVAQLAALAERDADGAADEILRRIESGETTAVHLVGEARGLDAAGRTGALAALSALHARGAIDDARMALVQMMLRVPE